MAGIVHHCSEAKQHLVASVDRIFEGALGPVPPRTRVAVDGLDDTLRLIKCADSCARIANNQRQGKPNRRGQADEYSGAAESAANPEVAVPRTQRELCARLDHL